MGTLISNIFEVAVHSCLMVIIVLALRLVFRRASRSTICMLWIIVGVRLVLFIPIESDYALMPRVIQNIDGLSQNSDGDLLIDSSISDSVYPVVNNRNRLEESMSYSDDKSESLKTESFTVADNIGKGR